MGIGSGNYRSLLIHFAFSCWELCDFLFLIKWGRECLPLDVPPLALHSPVWVFPGCPPTFASFILDFLLLNIPSIFFLFANVFPLLLPRIHRTVEFLGLEMRPGRDHSGEGLWVASGSTLLVLGGPWESFPPLSLFSSPCPSNLLCYLRPSWFVNCWWKIGVTYKQTNGNFLGPSHILSLSKAR